MQDDPGVFADLLVGLRVDVHVADPLALLGCGDERLAVVVAGGIGGATSASLSFLITCSGVCLLLAISPPFYGPIPT